MTNLFSGADLSNKYIYINRKTADANLYYIIHVNEDHGDYLNNLQNFMFYVSNNNDICTQLYDYSKEKFYTNENDSIYELTNKEWLDTYECFNKNIHKYPKELPSKLIQNN